MHQRKKKRWNEASGTHSILTEIFLSNPKKKKNRESIYIETERNMSLE